MMSENVVADKVIDARGSYCPGPLMELIKSIKRGEIGKIYEVWSKDEGSKRDIPKWVAKAKHELVLQVEVDDYTRFAVKKLR
jgi:TusA-related sulfurtransferase